MNFTAMHSLKTSNPNRSSTSVSLSPIFMKTAPSIFTAE
jgi:hypothetical protein